jgi:phosphotransferase system  glucose/maltose/N-acetylglucosamine-specific IIC component
MKKINILTIALLAYLLIMSYIGWPGRNNNSNYTEYFIVIGVTVAVIFLLRYLRIRLFRMKNKRKDDKQL